MFFSEKTFGSAIPNYPNFIGLKPILEDRKNISKKRLFIGTASQTGNSAQTPENVLFQRTTQSRGSAGFGPGSLSSMDVTRKLMANLAVFVLARNLKKREEFGESTGTREFLYAGRFFQ